MGRKGKPFSLVTRKQKIRERWLMDISLILVVLITLSLGILPFISNSLLNSLSGSTQAGLFISLLILNPIIWYIFIIKIWIIEARLGRIGWLIFSILIPLVPIMFYLGYYRPFLNNKLTIKQMILN